MRRRYLNGKPRKICIRQRTSCQQKTTHACMSCFQNTTYECIDCNLPLCNYIVVPSRKLKGALRLALYEACVEDNNQARTQLFRRGGGVHFSLSGPRVSLRCSRTCQLFLNVNIVRLRNGAGKCVHGAISHYGPRSSA